MRALGLLGAGACSAYVASVCVAETVCAVRGATIQQGHFDLRIKSQLFPRLWQPQGPSSTSPWTCIPRPRPHSPELALCKAY